jgi:DNA-binding Lrp family transcriptional regulator
MARKRNAEATLTVATTAAIASILGNILQAVGRAGKQEIAAALRADRTRVLRLFQRLEKTHATVRTELVLAAAALQAERMEVRRLGDTVAKLRHDYERIATEGAQKDAEISTLRARLGALEGATGKVKVHGKA